MFTSKTSRNRNAPAQAAISVVALKPGYLISVPWLPMHRKWNTLYIVRPSRTRQNTSEQYNITRHSLYFFGKNISWHKCHPPYIHVESDVTIESAGITQWCQLSLVRGCHTSTNTQPIAGQRCSTDAIITSIDVNRDVTPSRCQLPDVIQTCIKPQIWCECRISAQSL